MTTFSKLQIPVTFDSGAEIDIDSSTSEISRLAQSADGSVSAIYQNPAVINASVSSVTGLQSALDLKATTASLSVLDASLKSTGIDVEAGQIKFTTNAVYIGSGVNYPVSFTSDGKIKAESVDITQLTATTLSTTAQTNKGYTQLSGAAMNIYGTNGYTGITISSDSEGNAALIFYAGGVAKWQMSGLDGLTEI